MAVRTTGHRGRGARMGAEAKSTRALPAAAAKGGARKKAVPKAPRKAPRKAAAKATAQKATAKKKTVAKKKAAQTSAKPSAKGRQGDSATELAMLREQNSALKGELEQARARIAQLETLNKDVIDRIDWVIDSLQTVLEEKR